MSESRQTLEPEVLEKASTRPIESTVETIQNSAQSPQAIKAPEIQTESTAARDEWDTVRGLARRHLERLISLEPRVLRGDDPDAIHDIRVASRRLQQVLDLLYAAPRPREIRSIRRKIRRCRRTLSAVRNCDALVQRVEKVLRSKRASRRETWAAVAQYLRQRRVEHFEKTLRKLSKLNLAVLYVQLKTVLGRKELGNEPAQHPHAGAINEPLIPQKFYDRFGQSLARVASAFETQVIESQRDPKAPVIHGARVAAKRLRYLIEVVHAFKVPGSAERLAWLRTLQTQLGSWHDLEVLEQMMIEMVARPDFLRDHLELAMEIEKLIVKNRRAKKDYEEKYFLMTKNSEELRLMKEWLAYLVESPSEAFARA